MLSSISLPSLLSLFLSLFLCITLSLSLSFNLCTSLSLTLSLSYSYSATYILHLYHMKQNSLFWWFFLFFLHTSYINSLQGYGLWNPFWSLFQSNEVRACFAEHSSFFSLLNIPHFFSLLNILHFFFCWTFFTFFLCWTFVTFFFASEYLYWMIVYLLWSYRTVDLLFFLLNVLRSSLFD